MLFQWFLISTFIRCQIHWYQHNHMDALINLIHQCIKLLHSVMKSTFRFKMTCVQWTLFPSKRSKIPYYCSLLHHTQRECPGIISHHLPQSQNQMLWTCGQLSFITIQQWIMIIGHALLSETKVNVFCSYCSFWNVWLQLYEQLFHGPAAQLLGRMWYIQIPITICL